MHGDKIWAMDLHEKITQIENQDQEDDIQLKSKIFVITAGGDSTFKIWEDYTLEQEIEDKEALLKRVQEE